MTTAEFRQQFDRLRTMQGADRKDLDYWREMVAAAKRNANDLGHLERAVTWLLEHKTFAPSVAELCQALSETARDDTARTSEQTDFVARGCQRCGYTGWIAHAVRHGYSSVSPCACRLSGEMRPAPPYTASGGYIQ